MKKFSDTKVEGARGDLLIALVQMPWAPICRPSIAIGILQALVAETPHRCGVHYPGFDLAQAVGGELYDLFAFEKTTFGLSEHLFACDIFGAGELNSEAFLGAALELGVIPPQVESLEGLRRIRDEIIPQFLDRWCEKVLADGPSVVGFSAPFNQVLASLALANRIKRAAPWVTTIFGGAGFDDEMGREYHRAFPDIVDHVFLGEAEASFRAFLEIAGEPDKRASTDIAGVTRRGVIATGRSQSTKDMGEVPTPNYDAYFDAKRAYEGETGEAVSLDWLPFESSRGCWWGERSQCTFCGIIGSSMGFRAKPLERVVDEILGLSRRYRATRLLATDWIVSKTDRIALFEALANRPYDLEIFFETKSDLKRKDIQLMRAAGVTHVQPGIESFSTPVLKLMRKGASGIRQIEFLRNATEAGLKVYYNLLYGLPGEDPAWYQDMCNLLPALHHLAPPMSNAHPVEIHRFSPLHRAVLENSLEFEIRGDYRYNFPAGVVDLRKVGYFFESPALLPASEPSYLPALQAAIGRWMEAHSNAARPQLTWRRGPAFAEVVDTRTEGVRKEFELDGLSADLLQICEEVTPVAALKARLASQASANDLNAAIEALTDAGLLAAERDQLLTLPIRANA